MITTIHQPSFWPWLGLLDKIAKSDRLIIMDNVNYNKDSYQFKNIFVCNGGKKTLSLPVENKDNKVIKDYRFKSLNFIDDHLNKIRNYYLKAPYFKEIFQYVEKVYHSQFNTPLEFVVLTMQMSMEILDINTRIEYASEFEYTSSKGKLVFDICINHKVNKYLSGQGAKRYFTEDNYRAFKENSIDIIWHTFEHPEYRQIGIKGFYPGFSCLDLLFNCGINHSRDIFQKNINLYIS